MKNVMVLQNESRDGCSWYRVKQFVDHANESKELNCFYANPYLPSKDLFFAIKTSDIIFTRLTEYAYHFIEELKGLKQKGKLLVVDIDDNYEEINPLSNHYEQLGTQEVQLPSGQYLWKDGVAQFNVAENKDRHRKFAEVLRAADVVIVTTVTLATYAKQYNPSVLIIPNAINFSYFPVVKIEKPQNRIDIVWSGGSSHYADLYSIAEPLRMIMQKYPHVHYHNVGHLFKAFIKDLPEDRVHVHPWIDPEANGFRLATLGADIGLCPLEDMEFNLYKSSIKFYEYAACGIATVAKNMSPYSDDINGLNGLLYNDSADFYVKLEELITDPLKRISIAQEGRKYVEEKRDIQVIAKEWKDALCAMSDVKVESIETEWKQ